MKKITFILLSQFIFNSCKGQDDGQKIKESFCDIVVSKKDKEDFFIALYFVNKEKKYNIKIPIEYKDSWDFNNKIDSLLLNKKEQSNIFDKIKNNSVLMSDVDKWKEIEGMLNFPSKKGFSSEIFTQTIYNIEGTKSLFKKYLHSSKQDYSSLDEDQKGEIYFDTISYLFNLPDDKLLFFFSEYYYKLNNFSKE
ncbi:MAG: hypothetical protein L6262_06570 [Weeksellaceae bacterium]|nr:hypothetical protein [Weeksellaceae bacterium]